MRIKLIVTQPYAQNCYVVYDEGKNAVIIDPGADKNKISLFVMQNGLKPQAIFLTHGHFDHVGEVNRLKSEYNIKVYANIYEKGILTNPSKIYVFGGDGEAVKVDEWFGHGEKLKVSDMIFETIHTPGHTPGSCCFLLEDNLFSGDTLFRESIGRCDLEGGSFETIRTSIQNKLYKLDDKTNVYPGHGSMTDIGFEKNYNPYVTGE